jgi:hypothetical protein
MSSTRAPLGPFIVLLASCMTLGCNVELAGVPISQQPGMSADSDASLSPADDDELPPGDGGPPEGDGVLPTYRYAFDQSDGALDDAWKARAGQAQIWGRRLCMAPGESAELELVPGRYGYVRIDVPAQRGLTITAVGEDGALFELHWQETSGPGDLTNLTLGGELVAALPAFTVQQVELALDYTTGRVHATTGDHAQSARFEAAKLVGLAFRNERPDGAMACLDDLYVAGAAPQSDPFAMALAANTCLPASHDAAGRCLSERCCVQSAARFAELCQASCDGGPCACPWLDAEACAARCITEHPSHDVESCTELCSYPLFVWPTPATGALAVCADAYCAREPSEPTLEPLAGDLLVPGAPTEPSKRLKLERGDPPEDDTPTSAELVELDLVSGARSSLATLQYVAVDDLSLYTEPSHAHAYVATGQSWVATRIYAWSRADSGAALRELRFPGQVLSFAPAPSRRHAWVSTFSPRSQTAATYLLRDDAVILRLDGTRHAGFGPNERYAFATLETSTIIVDLVTGQSVEVPGNDSPVAALAFAESVALLSCSDALELSWNWLDVAGQAVNQRLPPVDCANRGLGDFHGLVPAPPELYSVTDTALVPVGTLPAEYEPTWVPMFAAEARVLYGIDPVELDVPGPSYGLRLATADGQVIAALEPPGPSGALASCVMLAVPHDATHGVVETRHQINDLEYVLAIDAYTIVGSAFTTRRLLEFSSPFSQSIFTRPDSSLFVIDTEQGPLVHDVVSGTTLPYAPRESLPRSVWAQYPSASRAPP